MWNIYIMWIGDNCDHTRLFPVWWNAYLYLNLDKAASRKELLMKWKAEKELKKKLDIQEKAKNKPFKVSKITEAQLEPFKKPTGRKVVNALPLYTDVIVLPSITFYDLNRMMLVKVYYVIVLIKRYFHRFPFLGARKDRENRCTRRFNYSIN